eukprot:GDKJ01018201.1.p1 GENE.GDKJ01018201.1~~GDKJ01018201.1.p1  ORF type:complete len:1695 (-),score=502.01 GDKJ01018201.1:66-4412(-)
MNMSGSNPSANTMTADLRDVRETLCSRLTDVWMRYRESGRWTASEEKMKLNEERCLARRRLIGRISSLDKRRQMKRQDEEGGEEDGAGKKKSEKEEDDEEDDDKPLAVLKSEEIQKEVAGVSNAWLAFMQAIAVTCQEKMDWRICGANSLVNLLSVAPKDTANLFTSFLSLILNSDKAQRRILAVEVLHEMFCNSSNKFKNIIDVPTCVRASTKKKFTFNLASKAVIKNATSAAIATAADEGNKARRRTVKGKRVLADSSSDESENESESSEETQVKKEKDVQKRKSIAKKSVKKEAECESSESTSDPDEKETTPRKKTAKKKRAISSDSEESEKNSQTPLVSSSTSSLASAKEISQNASRQKSQKGTVQPPSFSSSLAKETADDSSDEEMHSNASSESEAEDLHVSSSSSSSSFVISTSSGVILLRSLCQRTNDNVASVRTRAVQSFSQMLKSLSDHPHLLLIALDAHSDSNQNNSSSIHDDDDEDAELKVERDALPIQVSVKVLFGNLSADERVINRRAALSLFDDVSSLVSKTLRKSIGEIFKTLFPLVTVRALIEDSALAVRKQAMQSLTNLLQLNPNDELVKRLWLSLALPCILDPEASVSDATLDVVKSLVFCPLAVASASSAVLISNSGGTKIALGLLRSADEDAAELFQRALRICCLQKQTIVPSEIAKGLENVAAYDQRHPEVALPTSSSSSVNFLQQKKENKDIENVSGWNSGLWSLLEEASGLKNCAFSTKFLLSAWEEVESAILQVAQKPLNINLANGDENSSSIENHDLLRSAVRMMHNRRSINPSVGGMRTPGVVGAANSLNPFDFAIEDFKLQGDRLHKLCIIARRVLACLVNIAEKGTMSNAVKQDLREKLEKRIEHVDLPCAVLGKILALYTAVSSSSTSHAKTGGAGQTKGEDKNTAARVAAMQAEADRNRRIGDVSKDFDENAHTFIQKQIQETHQKLGQFLLLLANFKQQEQSENSDEKKNSSYLPAMTPGRNTATSLLLMPNTFLTAELLEKTCRHLELIGLLCVASPSCPVSELLPSLLRAMASEVRFPSRLRAHATWALGRLLLTVASQTSMATVSSSSVSSSHQKKLNKSNIAQFADFIALCTRPNQPTTLRNAALVVLCDLCRFASGAGVDRHLDHLSDTLADPSPLLRKQALWLLTQLASEDFVKLNARTTNAGPLVYRLLVCVSDDIEVIKHFAEVFFQKVAMAKCEKLVVHGMLEVVFFLNGVQEPSIGKDIGSVGEAFLLKNAEKRQKIYFFLIKQLKEIEKKEVSSRIVNNFLALFVDSKDEHSRDAVLQLPKTADSSLGAALKDALSILSSKELRIGAKVNSFVKKNTGSTANNDTSSAGATEEDAGSSAVVADLMKAVKSLLAQEILPVLLSLKRAMESKNCSLLKDVRDCVVELLADFRSSVHELLAGDRYFAKEVEMILEQRAKHARANQIDDE